jgi:hypothetical protein
MSLVDWRQWLLDKENPVQKTVDMIVLRDMINRSGDQPFCIETDTISLCIAPGTNETDLNSILSKLPGGGLTRYVASTRWSTTANGGTGLQGDPIKLTYSFPADGINVPGAGGETASPNVLNATLDSQFSSTTVWKTLFAQSFQAWHTVSGITYTEVSDDGTTFPNRPGSLGKRGDIRIVGHNIDGQYNVLAYTYFPDTGDMVFDTSEAWNITNNNYRWLRNTIMHEHGHGLGLGHVWPLDHTKLMEPYLNTNFDGPQDDDIRGSELFYGDSLENNDINPSATNLGTLTSTPTITSNLSTDISNDVDWFKFTVSQTSAVTITVTPVGSTYLVGNSDTTTSSINTLTINDLQIKLYNTNGTSLLLTQNATGAGQSETISNYSLPSIDTFYFTVSNVAGAVSDVQRYTLSSSVNLPILVAITQPTANQWVKGTIALTGTITNGGASPAYNWLLDGATTIASGSSASPSNPWDSTTNGDGSHTITLSSNSVTDVHTIKVDNTFPVVTLTAPTANQYVGSSMTTTGSASDSNLSGWQVKADGTTNLLTGSTPTWNQSVSISSLSEGSHSIQATATDLAGNSGLSTARTIIVDRSNPTVLLSSPTRNQRVGSSMNIKGSATDTNLSGWQVKADGATILLNGSTPTWDQSVSTSSLSEGSHSIQATATDLAGNSGSSTSKSITVDRNPTVVLNTPTSNQFVSSSMNVSGSASDSTLSGWQVKADGTTNLLTGSTTTWNQSVSTSSLNEGSHSIQVTATDIAGNSGLSTSITITVDRINPSVVINTPTDGANVSGTVSIGATIIDANPDTWVILLDGGQIANGTGTSPSTTWNAPSIGGSHIIRVEATDKVGNVGASQITVNTVTPDVTFTGTIKLGGWVGSVTPISSLPVQVTIDGGAPSSVSMTGTGNTATFQVSLPPTGIHNVRAKPNKFLSQTLTVTTSGSNIAGTFDGPTHAGLIQGDVTDNNVIDDFDFNAIITNFGNVGTIYDSNGDNVVDDFDFNAIIVNFGSTGS